MTRWLVNSFPTWVVGLIVVGGFTLLTWAGHRFMRRRAPSVASGAHNDAVDRFGGIIVAFFGFVLAFTIVELYGAMKDAELTVHREATLVAQTYRDSRVFEPAAAAEIERVIGEYVREVVDNEWDMLAEGEDSPEAWALIDELYVALQAYEPETVAQNTFYEEVVARLNELLAERRERIEEAEEELPTAFLVLIVLGAAMMMVSLWLLGGGNTLVTELMVVGVALLVGFNLLLVVLLDHPFSGDVRISPHVFTEGALSRFF